MSLSIDDILSDLSKLQQQTKNPTTSSPYSTSHPLLTFGHSLLPTNLYSDAERGLSASQSDASPNDDRLNELLAQLDSTDTAKSQSAALQLASLYLTHSQQISSLDQSHAETVASFPASYSTEEKSSGEGGLFDSLHRRIAKLQASNETYTAKLQEIRDTVAPSSTA